MNPEYIINSIKQISETLYREGEEDSQQRMTYRVQMLESKIREICALHDERVKFFQEEIAYLTKRVDK